jgi:O-antigen ligase
MLAFATMIQSAGYPGGLYFDEIFKLLVLLLMALLSCWACSNLLRDERVCRAVVWSLILGCVVRAALPVFGIATSYHVEGSGEVRVSALGQNPNQSAQVLAVGLLLLIGVMHLQARRPALHLRLAAWAGVLLLAYGLVHTGSRGGLATLVVGVLVILLTGPVRARLKSITIGLLMLGGLVFLALRTDVMRTRIEDTATTGRMAQREFIYPILIEMFTERPLLGWGPITNKYELAARLGDPSHGRKDAHNLLLELLTSGGILAAIPFALGAWLCLRAAWRARAGPRRNVPFALLLALLAGNMSQNRLSGFLLWIVLGYALSSPGAPRPYVPPVPSTRRPDEMPVWGEPRTATSG